MNRNGMAMLGWLVVAGLLMGQAPTAAAQASVVCPVDGARSGNTATIPRSAVGPAATLGGVGHDGLQSIRDMAWFSTVCPVVLDEFVPSHSECRQGVDSHYRIAFKDMQMHIQRGLGSSFRLWILDPSSGRTVAFVPDMRAYRTDGTGREQDTGPYEYLRGESEGDGETTGDEHMYYVYLNGSEEYHDLEKRYKIEVYYKDPENDGAYLCDDHRPDRKKYSSGVEGEVGAGRERPPGNP